MLSFEAARNRLLERVPRLCSERVPLDAAFGRVLAEPVVARTAMPPFAYSAMDGYALATRDVTGTAPFRLRVEGESRAGRPASPLVAGTACAISTGAEVPRGADAVLPREIVERGDGAIVFQDAVRAGQHIRKAGEDLPLGGTALAAGTRLGPAALGLAASLDVSELVVGERPRVTILCTGDELRTPGSAKAPGKIPESVSPALFALATLAGAQVRKLPPVPDDRAATERAIAEALIGTDLLLTVGGVSVGDHDWVRPALEAEGVVLDFWKVAIKPGKPIAFGRRPHGMPLVLGLPGNPASALITFSLFGMPLLRAMQGDESAVPQPLTLPLATRLKHKPGRLEFVRAKLVSHMGRTSVAPLDNQASGALTSLAWATALVLVPGEVEELPAGATVEVLRLQDL